MTGVCFIHNKLGIQYGFLNTKNVFVWWTGDVKLGTFLYNTLKFGLNSKANVGDSMLYSLDKIDDIKAIGSMLIELIKPLSGFLNMGSLTPIHLNEWTDSALEFFKKLKTVSAAEFL